MSLSRTDIQQLYDRYGAMVFRRCRTLVGDEQEAYDLMQEAFLRLITHSEGLRGEASPLTWLYRVSTNLALNRVRDARARAKKLAEPNASATHLPGMAAFQSLDPELRALVLGLLERVEPETRAIVIYYFVDELTLDEIAQLVSLSVPTLRKRIRHFQEVGRRFVEKEAAVSGSILGLLLWCLLSPVLDAPVSEGESPGRQGDAWALAHFQAGGFAPEDVRNRSGERGL